MSLVGESLTAIVYMDSGSNNGDNALHLVLSPCIGIRGVLGDDARGVHGLGRSEALAL